MAYGQDFGGRDSGRRDAARLPKPVVPPEFQDRMRPLGAQRAFDGGQQPGTGDWRGWDPPGRDGGRASWQQGPVQPVRPVYRESAQPSAGGGYGQAAYGRAPYEQAAYGQAPYGQVPYGQAAFGPGPWVAPRRQSHVARNVLAGVGGAAAVIIAIAAVAAANSAGHSLQNTGTAAGSTKSAGPPEKATVGTTITLTGNSSGEQMGVTVTKVISDASPADSFNTAPAGDRLVAVQFRLTDSGSAPYSDSPSNGAAVVDASGQSYQSGLETVAGCQAFADIENIAPGSSGLGCITFEVPTAAKIVAVQFTLDSGMGPDTGEWSVPG